MIDTIKIHDKTFKPYLTDVQLQARIKELADIINRDFEGQRVIFIAILNGSFMFAADFFKHLTIDSEISFIKLASYQGLNSTGAITTAIGLDYDLHQKHVVILEDIIDTGKTLHHFFASVGSSATCVPKNCDPAS